MIKTEKQLKEQYTNEALDLISTASSLMLNVSHKDLMSTKRDREIVDARRIAYALARNEFKFTYQAIAKFYDKNHATILHQVNTHEAWLQHEHDYKEKYETVKCFLFDKIGMERMMEYVEVRNRINTIVLMHKTNKCKE